MHTTRFDQGWRELNLEEKISAGISLSSAALFAVTVIGIAFLAYDYQVDLLRETTMKCQDRTGQKLVSETIRSNGSVECRYVRDIRGLAITK
jgi:hypothetical protein